MYIKKGIKQGHTKAGYRWTEPKHRLNYKSSCLRFDCINRGVECGKCFSFNNYKIAAKEREKGAD